MVQFDTVLRGASFCQVSRISPAASGMPCVTSGTQKWNGASPNFIVKAVVMIIEAIWSKIFVVVH